MKSSFNKGDIILLGLLLCTYSTYVLTICVRMKLFIQHTNILASFVVPILEKMKITKQSLVAVGLLASNFMLASNEKNDKKPRPNILFCIADDASFAHYSAAGCK